MPKKKVSIQIEGRNYNLITSDDERYVKSVVNEVIRSIRKAAGSSKQLDTRDCAVLAALDFCDDRNKAVKRNKDVVDKADKIIQQTNELNKLCSEYKEKLAEAINENTKLVRRNKTLEEQLAVLAIENRQLKSGESEKKSERDENLPHKKTKDEIKNEKLMGYVPMKQCSLFDKENNEKKKN